MYWRINGAVALGVNSTFRGTMLVNGAISLLDGATLFGRGLSRAGAISLSTNIVTLDPGCISSCIPDMSIPQLLNCPNDTSFEINSLTTCQPSLYWQSPEIFDDCREITTGFTGFMAFANWAQTTVGSGTAQYSNFAPDSIRIRGTSGGAFGSNSTATMCVRFSCSGNISFNWAARKSGIIPLFLGDHAYYLLNGVPTQLTPNIGSYAAGTVQLTVTAGDELCFRV